MHHNSVESNKIRLQIFNLPSFVPLLNLTSKSRAIVVGEFYGNLYLHCTLIYLQMDTITSTSLPSKAQFPMAREPGMPLSSFLAEDAPNSHSTAPALSMPSTTYSSLSLNTSPPPSVVPQTMGNFTGSTPGSPSPMPQQSSSAPIHQSPPLSSSTSSAATKKPAIGSLDDSQIYHAHIENERVLEYDPTGKYGKVCTTNFIYW